MMGDMADDYDWYDDERDEYVEPRPIRCRDCLNEDVYWAKDMRNHWVLYGLNSRKHVCKSNILSAHRTSAFDDLDGP